MVRVLNKEKLLLKVPVVVTKELIAKGEAKNRRYCPVALAFKQVLRRYAQVRVAERYARFDCGYIWTLPERLVLKISRYDRGHGMKPFKFQFPIPKEHLRASVLKAAKKK
jgi:hypothetical protein